MLQKTIYLLLTMLLATSARAQAQSTPPHQPSPPNAIQVAEPADDSTIATIEKYPTCISNGQAGYKGGQCKIQIWRSVPISPPTLIVPAGTVVHVELFEARQNEITMFALTSALTTPHSYGPTILQSIIPGLNTITETRPITPADTRFAEVFGAAPDSEPGVAQAKNLSLSIKARQDELVTSTNQVLREVQNAAESITCLSSYETLVMTSSPYTCSQASMLKYDDFQAAKGNAVTDVSSSTAMPLRLNDVSDLDSVVKSFYLTCLSQFPQMGREEKDVAENLCRGEAEALSTREALLDAALSDIQKADDTLIQSVQTLKAFVTPPKTVIFKFTAQKLMNMTVAIAGTEVVSKTNSTIASVMINTQATHIVLSSGIAFSNLKLASYTSAPVIVGGQPVLNSNGQTETIVTGTASAFSVIAPIALVSYRLNYLSNRNWENRCPNGCSFLISGGAGANLTSKEADFDAGPSFEIANVLFTPALHIGRDTRLTSGVTVGQMLGAGPPSPLPTKTKTVFKFAIAITYSIPLPNF